jgi:glycolate oxidase FAD binding subunit
MQHVKPKSEAELSDIIVAAGADDRPIDIRGHGTKAGWGRAVEQSMSLSLAGFSGITDYNAAELVLTAGAGTPLAEIESALAAEKQHLAFEPVDLGPLFGHAPDHATVGGVLASNLSGARRPFAGAARDYFLGFRAVNGRGELFKAGGKVVKNVTGYDVPKLLAGSFGTLAVMTEVTIKVLPAPESSLSLVVPDLDVAAANQVMTAALGSTADPAGAIYLPRGIAGEIVDMGGQSATILRLEGSLPSIQYRRQVLAAQLDRAAYELDHAASTDFWRKMGTLLPFTAGDQVVWLLSVPPATGSAVIARLGAALPDLRYAMDWGGGRLWLSFAATEKDAHGAVIRAALTEGGHATLIRAPAEMRSDGSLFSPDVPVDLLRRVRAAFDPLRLFNRGRLHPEL